ncbi:hypothetical protein RND81_08G163100 [Saponaria officinalis]|uniref:J domain-containing protein n=1 Tax=Saponaria officinalis TaxID=3572 RepID=A0AAW1J7Y7_SAPOF
MKTFNIWRTLLRNNHRNNHHRLRTLASFSHSLSASSSSSLPRRFFNTSPRNVLPNFPHRSSKRFLSETPSKFDERRCWNCSSCPTSELFLVCDSCGCIQPLDHSLDYFQIFDLEQKFDIEEASLEGKYKDWQKKLHPDLVHSKSEREREYAADQSSRVIDAYRTLSDPLSRGLYLMKLSGVRVDEEQTVSDPDLLAEIMELRESVEDAATSHELEQIQTQVSLSGGCKGD